MKFKVYSQQEQSPELSVVMSPSQTRRVGQNPAGTLIKQNIWEND